MLYIYSKQVCVCVCLWGCVHSVMKEQNFDTLGKILSLSLSIYLSIYLFVYLSIYLSFIFIFATHTYTHTHRHIIYIHIYIYVCVYYPYMGLCMPWVPEDLILNKWIEMYLLSGYVYGMYIHTCMNTCVGIYYIAYAFPMNL